VSSPSVSRQSVALTDMKREHITSTLERAKWRVRGAGGAAELLKMKPSTLESRMTRLSGCTGCELTLSTASDDPPHIRYVEHWSSEEELRTRVRSNRFLRLVAVMEEARSAPQLTFTLTSRTRGLDYVAEVRCDLTQEG